jgi:putative transposase
MQARTKREHLQQLVSEKSLWSRPLTKAERLLGFLGWHERGYLPHCDFPDLVQFVTFRLKDSMLVSRRREWEHLLKIEDTRERRVKLEGYLDKGIGKCHLSVPRNAQLMENALFHFNRKHYDLLAWCIMPNHVHILVHVWQTPLWKMIQNWKTEVTYQLRAEFTSERRATARHDSEVTSGPSSCSAFQSFWQREYWDTFMRDDEQTRKAVKYIESNPTKAKLCREAGNWPFSSAGHRDEFALLGIFLEKSHV